MVKMVSKDCRTGDNNNDAGDGKSSRQIWNQDTAHSSNVPYHSSSRFLNNFTLFTKALI